MNKFTELITEGANKTMQRRAKSVATAAEIAQQNLINELKFEKSNLELQLTRLTDLAPNSRDSLRPCDIDWDPHDWAKEIQETKMSLRDVTIQLDIAQNTYNEFFLDVNDEK